MKPSTQWKQAVRLLAQSQQRLEELHVPDTALDELVRFVNIVVFRMDFPGKRPPFVGFVGCTGTGKSTLFNSIAGRSVSATGWQAHNTTGPVLICDDTFYQQWQAVENKCGTLFLPHLSRKVIRHDPKPASDSPASVTGKPKELIVVIDAVPQPFLLIDLPDINTTRARDEDRLTLQVQPWLDAVIFLTDDETIYHRDYEVPIQLAERLHQTRLCAAVNRGNDRIVLDHPDLQAVKSFFGVEALFVLPNLNGANTYTKQTEFVQLCRAIPNRSEIESLSPLASAIADSSSHAVEVMESRRHLVHRFETVLSKAIQDCMKDNKPIPLDRILHDDVLHVLQHVGLKRFAVSNIYRFAVNVLKTGAVRKQFHLAFGNRRGDWLDMLMRFDRAKLLEEIQNRLSDLLESIQTGLKQHREFDSLYDIAPDCHSLGDAWHVEGAERQVYEDELDEILQSFEIQCREILSSDTLNASIKNDPVVALAVMITLVADMFTIPGLGSFLLVPSIFQYVPLGKFDKAKRNFQRELHNLIQRQISTLQTQFQQIRRQVILPENDPIWIALQTCSKYKG